MPLANKKSKTTNNQQHIHFLILAWTLFFGAVAAILFLTVPELDIFVSKQFYLGERAFLFNVHSVGKTLRSFFKIVFICACIVTLVGLVWSAVSDKPLFGLTFPKWFFVFMAFILGPGVITNTILKDNWGRARPFHIEAFGGTKTFTPALVPSDQCLTNCSFVSGEASTIYMVFFAFAMILPNMRWPLIAAGILAGTASGFVRIAQGGHFISDVAFSGILMMLTAITLHWLVLHRFANQIAVGSPFHQSLTKFASGVKRLKK